MKTFNPQRFGSRVKAAQKKAGLTVRAAAAKAGLDQATFHRVTQGKPPSVETYLRLSDWLAHNEGK